MALFGAFVKREEPEPVKPAEKPSTLDGLKDALKTRGIDVDEISAKREAERLEKESIAAAKEAERQERIEAHRLNREAAREMLKGGHLAIKVDGVPVDTTDLRCACGAELADAVYFLEVAGDVWRSGPDKELNLICGSRDTPLPTGWGLPVFNETVKCQGCAARHRVFIQIIL